MRSGATPWVYNGIPRDHTGSHGVPWDIPRKPGQQPDKDKSLDATYASEQARHSFAYPVHQPKCRRSQYFAATL